MSHQDLLETLIEDAITEFNSIVKDWKDDYLNRMDILRRDSIVSGHPEETIDLQDNFNFIIDEVKGELENLKI